jgi:hypothetical protein
MIKILAVTFFLHKCGDNDTSVARFVATLIKTLDTAALENKAMIISFINI